MPIVVCGTRGGSGRQQAGRLWSIRTRVEEGPYSTSPTSLVWSTEYLVVHATDIASLIVFRDLPVDGGVKETMEVFGLGIG